MLNTLFCLIFEHNTFSYRKTQISQEKLLFENLFYDPTFGLTSPPPPKKKLGSSTRMVLTRFAKKIIFN